MSTLPANVEVISLYDRTELVDHVIHTVQKNLFEGGLLVIAVLFAFLGNLRAAMIVALDLANKVDLIAFIATYSGFFAFFFLALMWSGDAGLARAGLVAAAFTLLCDVLETSVQLYITSSLPASASSLVLLAIGNTGKFLGFAVVGLCAGAAILARGGILGRLGGAACLAGALLVMAGINYSPAQRALPAGSALISLVVFLYAAQAAVRRTPEPRVS
jgi:hypothetical protein